jgi:hypothetical protein
MSTPVKTVACPVCKRGGRRVTQAGTIWRHKPFTAKFAGHMVPDCKGSGMAAQRPKQQLQQVAVAPPAATP